MANEGGGGEAQWAPQKLPSSLQIYRMTSRPLKTVSVLLVTSPSLRHSVSTPRILVSNKKYLAFTFTKNFFFKESQHDKIVYNDTIFIKKSILIEIKGFIFAFLNFTNSLSCEELLQFCIKTDKFYIISQGFYVQIKQYQRQFTNQCSVCKILEFLSFNKFNFIYKYFF